MDSSKCVAIMGAAKLHENKCWLHTASRTSADKKNTRGRHQHCFMTAAGTKTEHGHTHCGHGLTLSRSYTADHLRCSRTEEMGMGVRMLKARA